MVIKRVYFLTYYNINGFTGTPSRTRTVFEEVKKNVPARFLLKSSEEKVNLSSQAKSNGIGIINKFLQPFKNLIKFFRTLLVLFKKKPKIIHSFLEDATFVAVFYKLFSRCKVVFEMHRVLKLDSNINFSIRELISCKLSDKIIVMSHKMKEIIVKDYNLDPDKVVVIWGPVNRSVFKPSPLSKNKKFIVGYGGNDSKYQGIDAMLGAAKILKSDKRILFRFIGFEQSNHPKLKNVEYLGQIEKDKDFVKELSKSDIFVSAYEGEFSTGAYPHKMSTYLSLGRPLIASDVSDCKRIISESNAGFVFKPGSSKDLAEKILVASKLEKKKINEMAKNASEFASKNFDSKTLFKKLEKLYF